MDSVNAIAVKNLKTGYQNKIVLENQNWNLANGEFSLWIGPSGVGKTTMAKVLAGHLKPLSGEVLVHGKAITAPSRSVFLVSQENDLWDWMSVRETLDFISTMPNVLPLGNLLQEFGMEECLDRLPGALSEGQRKRLSILRGLLLKPQVLIIDEHLSSLDQRHRNQVLKSLMKVCQQNQISLIVISHFPEEFEGYNFKLLQFGELDK